MPRFPRIGSRLFVASLSLLPIACGGGGGGAALPPGGGGVSPALGAPQFQAADTGEVALPPEFAAALPQGSQVTFVGDEIRLRGSGFSSSTRVFFGMNNALAARDDSLLTTPGAALPAGPFTYVDPEEPGLATVLEAEADVRFVAGDEILVTVPAALACSADFSPPAGPLVRIVDSGRSSLPEAAGLFLVGPRFLALAPDRGADRGGYPVTVHGDFLSPWTQLALRYVDPTDGTTRVLGDGDPTNGAVPGRPFDDIDERFVDRDTLIVPRWPALPTAGGAGGEVAADLLLFENIDVITRDGDLEPGLGGVSACEGLRPEGAVALGIRGVRNTERNGAFTWEPTAATGAPVLETVAPARASEFGGETVLLLGRRFDAVSVDLSDPDDPGLRIECPPGSGRFVAPVDARLLDSGTIALTLPPCAVDAPAAADLAIRNRFTLDSFGGLADESLPGHGPTLVPFDDVLTRMPAPAAAPPAIRAVLADELDAAACRRFLVLGARFDAATAQGGVALLLPDGPGTRAVAPARVLRHGRDLLEVYLPDLGAPAADLVVGLRVANAAGSAEEPDVLTLRAVASAATPAVDAVEPATGPLGGGNDVIVRGSGFDPAARVRFGARDAARVVFVDANTLVARAPVTTSASTVEVTVEGGSGGATYRFDPSAAGTRPWLAALDVAEGGAGGGYAVLVRGAHLTAAAAVTFGGLASPRVDVIDDTCLRAVVPAGAAGAVDVRVDDPLLGTSGNALSFARVAGPAPAIDALAPMELDVRGGDRLLVAGAGFDADTGFFVDGTAAPGVFLPAPGLAAVFAPAGAAIGPVTLEARSAGGSDGAAVEYRATPAPVVLAVFALGSGDPAAPATQQTRLAIAGEHFFDDPAAPLTVTLTGVDAATGDPLAIALAGADLTLLSDDRIAFALPAGRFAEGPLGVEVETAAGTGSFATGDGLPRFALEGPRAPVVDAVTPGLLSSDGGARVVLSGRHFTDTTTFAMRTAALPAGTDRPVRGVEVLSGTVAVGFAPALPGGMPPAGLPGTIRATETDAGRAAAIDGDAFTMSGPAPTPERPFDPLFRVSDAAAPTLLAVVPERGTIDGGEPVLLLGGGFLDGSGDPGVDALVFHHPDLGPVAYEQVRRADAPLVASPGNAGRFLVVDDATILVITGARPPIPVGESLPVDVELRGVAGATRLRGGFVYENTPAVRTPVLRGITPNETRLNGTTAHLLSGGFLTEADRLVLTRPEDDARVVIDTDTFDEVNDFLVVFTMPDLRGTFRAGDRLDVHLEKDVPALARVRVSNVLEGAIRVSFAGPPTLDVPDGVLPSAGSSFGGEVVTIRGTFLTTNTRVLFGTVPAPVVVVPDGETLLVVVPTLPVDAPGDGLDLLNVHETDRDRTTDLAVFNQGGWAVLEDAFTWETQAPAVTGIAPARAIEGSTTRVVLTGERFLPGTTVTPRIPGGDDALAGSVANVVVEDFGRLTFDYTAAVPSEPTHGPLEIVFDVETNHGMATSPVFEVELSPFVTRIVRGSGDGDVTVPTTGIEDGARVVFVLEGGNFASGATLDLFNRQGDAIPLVEVDGLGAAARFEVVSDRELRFTAPFVFGNDSPTLIEGNPNVGPARVVFTNANTLTTEVEDAFRWVPAVMDFDSFGFTVPTGVPVDSVPHEITVADLNADGLPDAVSMVRSASDDLDAPEAYVFLADTFGDEDVNGDGVVPDFAGTFTRHVISDDTVRTEAGGLGRGGTVLAGNFDSDDRLELAIPTVVAGRGNVVRILIVDWDETSGSWVVRARLRSEGVNSTAVGGIAIGNFDDSDDRDDIVAIAEDTAKSKRRLTVWTSDGDWSFGQFSVELGRDVAGGRIGFLAAGNFDGEGLDELIWGLSDGEASLVEKEYPVVVGTLDPAAGSVSLEALTNFTGGQVHDIAIFDHDGDGADSAALIVQDEALLDGALRPGGIAVVLDPLGGKVSSYVETAFRGNGRALGAGDLDADGRVDLAAGNANGEFIVLIGRADGTFAEASGSWFLPTIPEAFDTRIESLRVADLNQDGLAEVWIGDIGAAPTSLKIFANASR